LNGKILHIAEDYNKFPIRCCHCLATSHLVKECLVLIGREKKEGMGIGKNKIRKMEKEQRK
jgi:hypothetical protein